MTAVHVPVANGQTVLDPPERATASADSDSSAVVQHSPLPFAHTVADEVSGDRNLLANIDPSSPPWAYRNVIGAMRGPNDIATANAEFIVRAVNSHDALVKAVLGFFSNVVCEPETRHVFDEARAALRLAEGF